MTTKSKEDQKIPQHIDDMLKDVFKEFGIETERDLTVLSPLKPGDNWLGQILEINLSGKNSDHKRVKKSIIAKLASADRQFRDIIPVGAIFEIEIYVYEVVLPQFIKIQEGKVNLFAPFAKCYRTLSTKYEETVFMENLTEFGFKTINQRVSIDYEHASMIMSALGNFHALSFGLKSENLDLFEKLTANIKQRFHTNHFLAIIKNLSDQVLNHTNENSSIFETLRNFVQDPSFVLEKIKKLPSKYSVICHGDIQTRNILFKHDSKSSQPTDLRIVDWQLSIVGSPVLDVSFFVCTSTDKEFRDRFYDQLLEIYYRSFSSFLRELGGDPEKAFPKEVFQEHLRKFSVFGLYSAFIMVSLSITHTDDVQNIFNREKYPSIVDMFSTVSTDEYYVRIKDLITDLIQYGYEL